MSIQNPTGMVVDKVLIAKIVDIAKEFYVAVLLDRIGGTGQPWPDEWRRLLETAGPQPPERLVQGT